MQQTKRSRAIPNAVLTIGIILIALSYFAGIFVSILGASLLVISYFIYAYIKWKEKDEQNPGKYVFDTTVMVKWGFIIVGGLLGYIGMATLTYWPLYTGIALVLVGLVLLSFYGLGFVKKVSTKTSKPDDHGSASWNTSEELSRVLDVDKGLSIGGGWRWGKSGHLVSVAGSGKGKGTCLIIPSLLVEPNGSYVVTDPKGENACITAGYQAVGVGQKVFILDPWDEQKKLGAIHGLPTSGFNPFVFLKNDMEELRDNCELIATYLVPDNQEAKDPFWNDRARSMIKIFLMHIITAMPEKDHNFWTLYKMLRYADDQWLALLIDLQNNMAEDELISISAQELMGIEKSGNTMASIKSTAQNATTIFESPQLRKSLATDDFNPYDLTDGNCTVYVVIPERYMETHAVWLRLVIGLCLKACNSKPNKRVNFLLDEFPVLGKMKDVQRGYAFARGQNIVLWAFAQSLSQLKDIYGEDGMGVLINNSAILQFFGVKDNYTTEYISKMLGDGTQTKASVTHTETGTSTGFQTYARRLLTPDEVEKCPGIITTANGLRGVLPPIPYYMDENIKAHAAPRPRAEQSF